MLRITCSCTSLMAACSIGEFQILPAARLGLTRPLPAREQPLPDGPTADYAPYRLARRHLVRRVGFFLPRRSYANPLAATAQ